MERQTIDVTASLGYNGNVHIVLCGFLGFLIRGLKQCRTDLLGFPCASWGAVSCEL